MILLYEKNYLTAIDNKVTSSDSIIKLSLDKRAIALGVLSLANGHKKIIEFIDETEEGKQKIGRLIITEEDIPFIQTAKFYIELINGDLKQSTNYVPLSFDTTLIKTDVKRKISTEYKELLERVNKLEEKINFLKSSRILDNINITNKELIEPGMIPVSIDNKGNFVALHPFSNHIVEINGQKAANGAVIIDASMIDYKKNGKTLEQTLGDLANAIGALNNLTAEVISNQKEIRKKVDDLDIKLSTHINSGII